MHSTPPSPEETAAMVEAVTRDLRRILDRRRIKGEIKARRNRHGLMVIGVVFAADEPRPGVRVDD